MKMREHPKWGDTYGSRDTRTNRRRGAKTEMRRAALAATSGIRKSRRQRHVKTGVMY